MLHIYSFLTYIFVTAYTPGPNNIMSMVHAGRMGFRKSFRFNLGILCGFSVVMLLCTVFSAVLFQAIPMLKPFIQIIGAAYMLWLAYKTWRSSIHPEATAEKDGTFLSGFLLQFMNPKIIIYGITSMSSYILPYFENTAPLFGFALLLAFVGFTGTLCWAVFGSLFYKLFSKYSKIVNSIMAILLIYCAVSLFL